MSGKTSQHVIWNPKGGWAVLKSGSSKATKVHPTQEAAIQHAHRIARNQKVELYIHGRDGQVRHKDNFREESPAP